MNKNPIGIFDSGIGGISILKEVIDILPNEDTVYLADSKNAPYGNKSKDEIIELCIKNIEKLISFNAKLIIVACNTATTNAIQELRAKYEIPIIGIEPAIKPAAIQSKTKKIGVLATKGTLTSSLFAKTANQYTQHIEVTEIIGTGLVSLIEEGKINSRELELLLESYIKPLIAQDIDHIVLGCTHYPFLKPILNKMLPDHVTILDSGKAIAKQTKKVLEAKKLISNSNGKGIHKLFTNTNIDSVHSILSFANIKFKYQTEILEF